VNDHRREEQRYFSSDATLGSTVRSRNKKSTRLREIVQRLPRDRIVIETDSPYLSPEPYRGKPNKPANVVLVNEALASTLGISADECAAMTTANTERFFGIHGGH